MVIYGNIVDVFSESIYPAKLIVENGHIKDIIKQDVPSNYFILPGLVDSHVHIESSMLVPSELARLIVPHGTVATISDPHEIANVLGMEGIDYMIENAHTVPVKFHFMAPSCVPATPLETSGAIINSDQVIELLERKSILGLAEMMNFPGVIHQDKDVMQKVQAANQRLKPIDGHAPGLRGEALKTYVSYNILTDHECNSLEEAVEKIGQGMYIQIREGSAAKNFEALHPLIRKFPERIMFCNDDAHPDDIIKYGHMDKIIRMGLKKGYSIFELLLAAVINPVKHYKLQVGMLQKNDPADFIVVDNLEDFNILESYIQGKNVYKDGKITFPIEKAKIINAFDRRDLNVQDLIVKDIGKNILVIVANDGDLWTGKTQVTPKIENKAIISDTDRDILKLVVLNRYENTSKPSIGFIKNVGLKHGAIASSIAHDSHNIVAVGVSDDDIYNAIQLLIENKGGISLSDGTTKHVLPLPVGGIMSDKDGYTVARDYEKLNSLVKSMGSTLTSPFMTLSFMSLLVIPELKLGDKGLFDVNTFSFTSLYV